MKTRSSRKPIPNDDRVVSTAVAKRDWFLKPSDLATLPHAGGGAAWGVGRFPTYYSVKDLDRVALRVHGATGLAKKKATRKRRLENKSQKAKEKRVVRKGPLAKRKAVEEGEEEAVEEIEFSGRKRRATAASDEVLEDVEDDDKDVRVGNEDRQGRKKMSKSKSGRGGWRPGSGAKKGGFSRQVQGFDRQSWPEAPVATFRNSLAAVQPEAS